MKYCISEKSDAIPLRMNESVRIVVNGWIILHLCRWGLLLGVLRGGQEAIDKSYMWAYLSETDGLSQIVLYDYRIGRSGDHLIDFLKGFIGMLQCDWYAVYRWIEKVVFVCYMAYCRWKFFDAIQIAFRKKQNLDINLDQALEKSNDKIASNEKLTLGENV